MKRYALVFIFTLGVILFTLSACRKTPDPLLDENSGLLLQVLNVEDSLLTRTCLDWAKLELSCVKEEQESPPTLEEVLKEEYIPNYSEWKKLEAGESEFSLCTKEKIEDKRLFIQPPNKRDDIYLKRVYRCLKNCTWKFNKKILCPTEKTFTTFEEYQAYRDIQAGYLSLEFKECENACFIQTD